MHVQFPIDNIHMKFVTVCVSVSVSMMCMYNILVFFKFGVRCEGLPVQPTKEGALVHSIILFTCKFLILAFYERKSHQLFFQRGGFRCAWREHRRLSLVYASCLGQRGGRGVLLYPQTVTWPADPRKRTEQKLKQIS